ncbi:glycosyltransferase family 2 protein [Hymenobacter telluris]|nr:glycosyltransferase [Hymenobacter telluris]
MIPTYNCSVLLREAIASVLAQDLGPDLMQIQVVDDASTDDDVKVLVNQLGAGRVEYYRQSENVGSLRNFETCINRARGQLIHLLHGNDRVLAGFYEKLAQLFQQYPEAGAAFSHYAAIDENGVRYPHTTPAPEAKNPGILPNWILRIAERQRTQYVSIAVRRKVYEKLGAFYGTTYGEDWEMWVRIAANYPVAYHPDVLAEYRGHTNSISWAKARSGQIIPDLLQVMERIQQHVPAEHRKRILNLSKQHCANAGVGNAYVLLKESNDWALANSQIKQALALSNHPNIYYHLFKFYIKRILRMKFK